MNFRENSKRFPFGKLCCNFFVKRSKKTYINVQNLQHKFLDLKCPFGSLTHPLNKFVTLSITQWISSLSNLKEAKILGEIERLHQQFSGHTYGEANNIAIYTNCITLDVYANLLVCLQISDNTKNLKFKLSQNADVWFRF